MASIILETERRSNLAIFITVISICLVVLPDDDCVSEDIATVRAMVLLRNLAMNIARFNIYPEKDRRYFYKVRIFADQAAMRTYFRRIRGQDEKFAAVTLSLPLEMIRKGTHATKDRRRYMGEILFDRTYVGAEAVVHEMTHAATHYAELMKINPFKNMTHNERFAEIQGNLARQMVKQMYMHKIYRKRIAVIYRG